MMGSKNPLNKIKSLIKRIGENYTLLESEGVNKDIEFEEVYNFFREKLSKLNKKDLKYFYIRDYKKTPNLSNFGKKPTITEGFNDILPIEDAIEKIRYKYSIPEDSFISREGFNGIRMYIIIADIGENVISLEDDMRKMGYFVCSKREMDINGDLFQLIQFEPLKSIMDNKTDYIKKYYKVLYHWTPAYNVENIMIQGLTPQNQNDYFSYPPRIYLTTESDLDIYGALYKLGQELCLMNNNPKNDGYYCLLEVELDNLNIDLFFDPNSPIGVYTEDRIPKENIKILGKTQFSLKKLDF